MQYFIKGTFNIFNLSSQRKNIQEYSLEISGLQADIDGERLISDVINNISRPIAFDAVMRVRTSTGVRPTDFYGHFFMSNTTDMELASIDCDKVHSVN